MSNARYFNIDGRTIGDAEKPYCVAEVGINHNGDINLAKKMIRLAKEAGVDAVKFQTFTADEFCGGQEQVFTYRSQGKVVTEPMVEIFRRYEMPRESWRALKDYCVEVGLTFFSTPQNKSDLDVLLEIGVPVLKVGSDDLTNLPLIRHYASTNLPLILSSGMSDLSEVHQALNAAGWFNGNPVALLLCTSQYPTPPRDVNIAKLTTLKGSFPGLVLGFSDHTVGELASGLAVARGARIFEKHFTLSKDLPGPDHWFSVDPEGLADWVSAIHVADTMIGCSVLMPTQAELDMRTIARRRVVALRDISCGETLTEENLGLRRSGIGLSPDRLDEVFGLKAVRDIKKGEGISIGDMRRG